MAFNYYYEEIKKQKQSHVARFKIYLFIVIDIYIFVLFTFTSPDIFVFSNIFVINFIQVNFKMIIRETPDRNQSAPTDL